MRTEQIAVLNKALDDLRVTYDNKLQQELALSNEVLQKARQRQENDAILKNERQQFDSRIEQARAQLEDLDNERLKLKTLIESFMQRQDICANRNDEVTRLLF